MHTLRQANTFLSVILFIFISFTLTPAKASHGSGSVPVFEKVGQDSIKVSLTLYRDCNGMTLLPQKSIQVTSGCGNMNVDIQRIEDSDISPVCATGCSRCATGCMFPYGAEKHVYEGIADLSSLNSCCEFEFSYQLCCYNNSISNINAPSDNVHFQGTIDICQGGSLHTPEFINDPLKLICNGQPYHTTHRVNDFYGDSVTYELVTPYGQGGTEMTWASGYNENEPFDYINKLHGPDYPFPWGFHFDNQTGDLRFTPDGEMMGLYSVEVTQFKNDNVVSKIRRNMTLRIMEGNQCPASNQTLKLDEYLEEEYLICADEKLAIDINIYDPDQSDSIFIYWPDTRDIEGASYTEDSGHVSAQGQFTWTPDTSHIRPWHYFATFQAEDNACPVTSVLSQTLKIRVNPSPEITYNTDIQSCGNVSFNAELHNIDEGDFEWIIDNDTISDATFTRTFDPGQYPYQLTLSGVGCERVFQDTVEVPPFLSIDAGQDIMLCDGNTYTLEPTAHHPEGNAGSVQYTVNGHAFFNSTEIEPTGDTLLIVQAEDQAGCQAVDSLQIDYRPLPEPDIEDKFFCADENLGTATTAYHTDYDIEWRSAAGQLLDAGQNFPLPGPGDYELHILDMQLAGCSAVKAFEVQQDEVAALNLPDTAVCKGNELQVSAGIEGITYQWRFHPANQTLGNDSLLTYTVEESGEISVEVTRAIDGHFCQYTDTFSVEAAALPDTNIAHPGNHCLNAENVTLPTAQDDIKWEGPGVKEAGEWNISQAGPGMHTLSYKVTHEGSGCQLSGAKQAEVYNLPALSFTAEPETGEAPLTVTFTGSIAGDGTEPVWEISDDAGSAPVVYNNEWEPEHTFDSSGLYTIAFSAADATTGCRDTVWQINAITVSPANLMRLETTGEVRIYPNPARNEIHIESNKSAIHSVRLKSFDGRLILDRRAEGSEAILEREDLPAGSYLISVELKGGERFRRVVVFE